MSEPNEETRDENTPILPAPESPAERGRRLNVALSPETESILRRVSERTGIPISDLRRAIEESPQVQAAAVKSLRYRYEEWWAASSKAEDIFGKEE